MNVFKKTKHVGIPSGSDALAEETLRNSETEGKLVDSSDVNSTEDDSETTNQSNHEITEIYVPEWDAYVPVYKATKK